MRVPATAFTFSLLKFFQELNFQGKTNLYDFWKTIERITDNSGGIDVPNRYKQLSHVVRLWRHLTMLKRFRRTHDPTGAGGTKLGELVVECAACPHPDKNLPDNWESSPPHLKWLYTLFLMMDANFHARCKDRGFDDVELAPGWAYYVEETAYLTHIMMRTDEKDLENTCSAEHNAIRQASFHREGYIASGVGAILCARHALVRKNGAGDLQQGERQANMDYLFFVTLLGLILTILISYDIEAIVSAWNWDHTKPDPYEEPSTTISMSTVKLELAQQEAIEGAQGLLLTHEVTPAVFIQVGLELEEQQCALRQRTSTSRSVSDLADLQSKRNVLGWRIDSWRGIQDIHMPLAVQLRATEPERPTTSPPIKPEDIKLWLPSSIP
ncbi:hypothetical protein GSI_14889 [Ganoderma sinense ZZ0214-1]|uniref:CxC2-like cysteine cluster KDZ transposase-associated domain-containing protein n=1 Tax=Ganoderma sinense ZZ0214-1 TaxID=1077348 RepID=A0A2G8RPZ6_9APHY|nr:hypothetical protein GSI_14889 [Ganoderma sinense ZZ0214-1]